MKRHAVTLVLAALAILATAYLLIVDRGTASDAERETRAHHVFTAFRSDEITRIELERPKDHLILVRDAKASDAGQRDWRLVDAEGASSPVDQAAAAALVVALDSASPLRAASAEPAEFATIRATGAITMGRIAAKLQLGKEAASPEGAAYLRVDADPPIVVASELAAALLRPADQFRAKEIVPNVAERLDALAIDHGDRHAAWTRTGPSTYRLASGERASRAALDRVELALVDLRAESFLAADEAARSLADATTVTLRTEGGDPLTLRFGGACPDHLDNVVVLREANAELPRLGACVAKAALAAFDVDPATLVEHHVFQARADEVSELRLAAPNASLDLARKGNGWHERAPQDRDLSPGENEAAAALLDRMIALEGEPHVAAKEATKADRTATLRYGEPALDDTFAFDETGHAAEMTIDARAVALLTPSAVTLRPLAFWDPPLDRLHVDEVTLRCDGREQKATNGAAGWSLGALPADGPAVLDVVDAVAGGRAERWLSADEATDASAANGASCQGPTAIALHVAAHGDHAAESVCVFTGQISKSPNGETIVHVERRGGGKPAAAASGSSAPVVGTAAISSDFHARACGFLVDRHRFLLPDDAQTVTLRAAGHVAHRFDVEALRNGGASDDPTDASDSAANAATGATAAIAALDGLVADDVAHLGPATAGDGLDTPALVVTIASADGGAARTLKFGREIAAAEGPIRRATVDGLAAVFTFASAKLAPLFAAADVIQKAP